MSIFFHVKPCFWKILFCFFVFVPSIAHAIVKTDLLFVFYDAGETLMLQPVLSVLKEKQIDFKVMAMGTSKSFFRNSPDQIDINMNCGLKADIDQTRWQRNESLDETDLKKISGCVQTKVVITGMVSQAQYQISRQFKLNGVQLLGSYDGLNEVPRHSISFSFLDILDQVLVASESIRDQIKTTHPRLTVEKVGQPILEKWIDESKQLDRESLLRQIHSSDHLIDLGKKTVLYVGGYGENYEQAFGLFLDSIRTEGQYNFLISLHPKVDGSLERRIIAEKKISNVQFLPNEMTTVQGAMISDVIVTQRSTVGTQALFLGKPVIYLDVPGSEFSNIVLKNHWAQQVTESQKFKSLLAGEILAGSEHKLDLFEKAKIPKNSVSKIVDQLIKTLRIRLASSEDNL